jgi:hypothetical protein
MTNNLSSILKDSHISNHLTVPGKPQMLKNTTGYNAIVFAGKHDQVESGLYFPMLFIVFNYTNFSQ